ncbi:SRPBCC domain-containing protein [Kitasatospora sp. NPDC057692]|uniref:SRPBCC family protein n=1 Tax=Kitasatospora sp. NPDC057692 TaxID=3346215 RepID=UPI0036A28C1B
MTHPFEIELETVLPASPDEVWEAIATGPGLDSWFMGRNELDPREGGTAAMQIGGHREDAVITAYEPGRRLATRTATAEDGRFMAFEYLIEGRAGSATALRVVHCGLLGDDWEDEYDALRRGWPFHLHTLREYLAHFPGRTGTPVFAVGSVPGRPAEELRAALADALALPLPPAVGARLRAEPAGLPPLEGEVVWADAERFAARTADGLYTFHHSAGLVLMFHHLFGPHQEDAEPAWQQWLAGVLA